MVITYNYIPCHASFKHSNKDAGFPETKCLQNVYKGPWCSAQFSIYGSKTICVFAFYLTPEIHPHVFFFTNSWDVVERKRWLFVWIIVTVFNYTVYYFWPKTRNMNNYCTRLAWFIQYFCIFGEIFWPKVYFYDKIMISHFHVQGKIISHKK